MVPCALKKPYNKSQVGTYFIICGCLDCAAGRTHEEPLDSPAEPALCQPRPAALGGTTSHELLATQSRQPARFCQEVIIEPTYLHINEGLRIRSIFGRIRILQIRILKSDPDPGSYWHFKNQFKHQIFF